MEMLQGEDVGEESKQPSDESSIVNKWETNKMNVSHVLLHILSMMMIIITTVNSFLVNS